jgi:uncharacterized protein involved in outer membrane biogenesis
VLLIAAYALAGYRLLPLLLRSALQEQFSSRYGRTLQIGALDLDPFTLSLRVEQLGLPDRDRAQIAGFGALTVDLELWLSLWERALVFRQIRLERPALRGLIREDGALNLSDFASAPQAAPTKEQPLPAIWIQQLTVHEGELEFSDRSRTPIYAQRVSPVSFSLHDFRTNSQGGSFSLQATGARGAVVARQPYSRPCARLVGQAGDRGFAGRGGGQLPARGPSLRARGRQHRRAS